MRIRNRRDKDGRTGDAVASDQENDVWVKMDDGDWNKVFRNGSTGWGSWVWNSQFDFGHGNQPRRLLRPRPRASTPCWSRGAVRTSRSTASTCTRRGTDRAPRRRSRRRAESSHICRQQGKRGKNLELDSYDIA